MSKNSNKKKNTPKKKVSVPKKSSGKKSISKPVKKSSAPKKEKTKKTIASTPKKEIKKVVNNTKPAVVAKVSEKVKKNDSKPKEITTKVKQTKSNSENIVALPVSVRPLTEKPLHDKKGNLIQPVNASAKIIKLRIDGRTIISVKSKEALRMWKEKYPNAVEEE